MRNYATNLHEANEALLDAFKAASNLYQYAQKYLDYESKEYKEAKERFKELSVLFHNR